MFSGIFAFLTAIPGMGWIGKMVETFTTKFYDAKVAITTARIGGDRDVAVELIRSASTAQSAFYQAVTQSKVLAFIVLGFAFPFIAWANKVVVWDIVLGWGSTDPLRGQIAEWGNTIILSVFASGTTLALGNMWFNKKG